MASGGLSKVASILGFVTSVCLLVLSISFFIRVIGSGLNFSDNFGSYMIAIFIPLQTILVVVSIIAQEMQKATFISNCRFLQFYAIRGLVFIIYALIYFNNHWLQWITGIIAFVSGIFNLIVGACVNSLASAEQEN